MEESFDYCIRPNVLEEFLFPLQRPLCIVGKLGREKKEARGGGQWDTQRGPLRRREGEFDQTCIKKFKCPGVVGAGSWGILKFRIQQQQLQALFEQPYKYILVLQKLFIIMVQEYELKFNHSKINHFVHNLSRHDIYSIYIYFFSSFILIITTSE